MVVCGLEAEARIARGPGVLVIAGGGDQSRLARDLAEVAPRARAVLSFGICGGLAPDRQPGDVIIAESVVTPAGERLTVDRRWADGLIGRLTGATLATVAGAETPVITVEAKAALRARTSAAAVDMESYLAASAAAGCPFAVLRVVSDPAGRALPHAAAVGMRPDGKVDLPAILRSLGRDPGQLPGLIRTGLDARRAFAALFRCRQLLGPEFLGPGLAGLDLG